MSAEGYSLAMEGLSEGVGHEVEANFSKKVVALVLVIPAEVDEGLCAEFILCCNHVSQVDGELHLDS